MSLAYTDSPSAFSLRNLPSRLALAALALALLAGCREGPVFVPAPLQHFIVASWAEQTGALAQLFPSPTLCMAVDRALCPCEPAEERARPVALPEAERLDLLAASIEELDTLPGVGPRIAEGIVALRDRGRLRDVDDLLRVRGIGPARLERLLPLVRVGRGPP
jgi:competence ComEA-like helix-hairpin-helix protein